MTLTPAQVRDHARALILEYGQDVAMYQIVVHLDHAGQLNMLPGDPTVDAIADAILTARITVDWDEEGAT